MIQGRIAIDQAIRILEGKDYLKHVGPALMVVGQDTVKTFDSASTLAPEGFKPTARAKVLEGKCWTVPVLANGRIYCRNAAGDLLDLSLGSTADTLRTESRKTVAD